MAPRDARGALAALGTGLVLGLGRLTLELNSASLTGLGATLAAINSLHFAILLFVISAAVLALVSIWTVPPESERVAPLTLHYHRKPTPASR